MEEVNTDSPNEVFILFYGSCWVTCEDFWLHLVDNNDPYVACAMDLKLSSSTQETPPGVTHALYLLLWISEHFLITNQSNVKQK